MSRINKEEEKHLDLELLVFYFCVAIITLFLYIIRHPLLSVINDNRINSRALFSAYSFDLFIFLIVLLPYLILILYLILFKIIKKTKVPDNVMVILFFPLLSFFTKGMSLLNIYLEYSIVEIFKDNFAFFMFLFIGPVIVIIHKIIIYISKKRK
ncbi:MAG: hypothetical protein KAT05_01515 [Spirochaetes bacterium]|nr:hypothetical protein [Spirochaetota bacterium]